MMEPMVHPGSSQLDDPYSRLGQRLRQLRLARNLSIEALHEHTRVPRSFIQALESGQGDRFPEAVYVHYLIIRLGIALELANLPSELPDIQPSAVVPSWRNPTVAHADNPVFWVDQLSVQLGGIILLTGATCGLSWALFSHLQTAAQDNQPVSLQHLDRETIVCGRQTHWAAPEQDTGVQFSSG
ncbi:MAG: helix-turn-helix transcriptional regulator [Cyanobacteria bacterium P01_G01_bin.54]